MRKFLRKLLDVPSLNETNQIYEQAVKTEIEKLVCDGIYEALKEDSYFTRRLRIHSSSLVSDEVKKLQNSLLADIGSEKFIDAVVERINRKQLK